MNKLKFYQSATLLLLFLNVGFILFGMMRPPERGNRAGLNMAKELLLDDAQRQAFTDLGKSHHHSLMKLNSEQKKVLKTYFDNLPNKYDDETSNLILESICNIEERKVDLTYNHFIEIYDLLDADQKEKYLPAIEKALSGILMLPKNKME